MYLLLLPEVSSKGLRQVAHGVWVAIGYALANSMLLEAPQGLVVVDTTESMVSARKIMSEFKKLRPEKRVRSIVYTHNHADHTFGAEVTSSLPVICTLL